MAEASERKSLLWAEICHFNSMNTRYGVYLLLTAVVATLAIAFAFRPTPSLLITHVATTTASSTAGVSTIPVSLSVDGKRYTASVPEGSTIIELMRSLESAGLEFTGREYPSLGFFVESINGKKNQKSLFWFLYINGVSSATGASQTRLNAGDSVQWRYKKGH